MDFQKLEKLCKLIRYDILTSTTEAGSGHATSSLSAVELMTTLFFAGFFHQDLADPKNLGNDRFILSKGHAAPLLYSLYHAAGAIDTKKLLTLRKFGSELEGHPNPRFPYVDVATGSLGQGLSIGVGMALGQRLKLMMENRKSKLDLEARISKVENQSSSFDLQNLSSNFDPPSSIPKVWVLLGDSEMASGQVWEALGLASYYKLNNLVAIIDVNRLGQRGETMLGWNIEAYEKRISSFGWQTIIVNKGHDLNQIYKAFEGLKFFNQPTAIIAKTIKGKGISFLENKDGWHGKPVSKEMLDEAIEELGEIDFSIRDKISKPTEKIKTSDSKLFTKTESINYKKGEMVATREAYGNALVRLGKINKNLLAIDAEVSNSTYADKFKSVFPERFFEMFIAEQNMIGVAIGLSKLGFPVFASTFAGFLSRAFDQIRMSQYSLANLKIVQSHTGVSIGQDGPSQMALEDIAMMRSILTSVILYPSDAVSTEKLVNLMARHDGISYLRTTRPKTPVIYDENEEFEIGGLKIHKSKITNPKSQINPKSKILIISAGITLHEALKAQNKLAEENIETTVVDLYSIKPLDEKTIKDLAEEYKNIIIVEDHYPYGGIGEAISNLISNFKFRISNFVHLAVKKIPMSGTTEELLHFEEIDVDAIVKAVRSF